MASLIKQSVLLGVALAACQPPPVYYSKVENRNLDAQFGVYQDGNETLAFCRLTSFGRSLRLDEQPMLTVNGTDIAQSCANRAKPVKIAAAKSYEFKWTFRGQSYVNSIAAPLPIAALPRMNSKQSSFSAEIKSPAWRPKENLTCYLRGEARDQYKSLVLIELEAPSVAECVLPAQEWSKVAGNSFEFSAYRELRLAMVNRPPEIKGELSSASSANVPSIEFR